MSLVDAGLTSVRESYDKNKKPLPVVEYKSRLCLKCRREFQSTGPSNRICETCNESNLRLGRRSCQETSAGHRVAHTAPHH